MKNLFISIATVLFMMSCDSIINDEFTETTSVPQNTVDAVMFNKETRSYDKLCTSTFYMSGDTLFVDKRYSFLGITFAENGTEKYDLERAIVFRDENKIGDYYYVVINKENTTHRPNTHVCGIILRDCRYNQPKNRLCADSYIYNISQYSVKQPIRTDIINNIIRIVE